MGEAFYNHQLFESQVYLPQTILYMECTVFSPDSDVSLLWDIAKVSFPIKVEENTILPLDLVKILNDNQWEVKVWNWETTEGLTIDIKKVWWNFVELKEALPGTTKLVVW